MDSNFQTWRHLAVQALVLAVNKPKNGKGWIFGTLSQEAIGSYVQNLNPKNKILYPVHVPWQLKHLHPTIGWSRGENDLASS